MKKLTGLLIILAVLVLGGYYGMGVLTERAIKKNIQVIDQSNGLFAEIEQYNRGFVNSTAQIKWHLHVPEHAIKDANGQSQIVAAQDYEMHMPVTIYHGPVMFTNHGVLFGTGFAESTIPFPDEYKAQFDASYTNESVKPKINLSIFVNYLNNSKVTLNVPSFKLFSKDSNGIFDWKGMDSITSVSSGVDKVAGGFTVDGLAFTKDDSKVTLGKVSSDYDLHETPAGIFLGDANFSLPSFVIELKGQKLFEIGDFSLSSDSNIENNLFSTHFNVSLKSLIANGQSYGPGDIEISLKNLDADVLAKINEQATAMQNGSEAERQRAMLDMLPQLPKLFSQGAQFEISQFKMKLPEGMINGSLNVSLPKGEGNPFELIQKIHGQAKLTVPVAVVKQLMQRSLTKQMEKQPDMQQALVQQLQNGQPPQANQPTATPEQLASLQTEKQMAALEQSGLVVVQGSDYVVEVDLDQGKFTVNSKPFDPASLKF